MERSEQTIEAEVVEIDGVSVEPRPVEKNRAGGDWQDWRSWQGKVRELDPRWWPLWAFLGAIGLVLLVVVGMCAAVILVIYKLFKALFMGFVSLFLPTEQYQRR
ncbi:hypothetical protein [Luteolibacter sp. AS25]|uniref:hypothetical protein n=1 Tax=Luteolibacter sp. AS25 TaxID=3135776 RepID=UPI00398B3316